MASYDYFSSNYFYSNSSAGYYNSINKNYGNFSESTSSTSAVSSGSYDYKNHNYTNALGSSFKSVISDEAASYLKDIKSAASDLKKMAFKMANSYPPAFQQMTASSSDVESVVVTTDSSKAISFNPSSVTIQVDQAAQTQKNYGKEFKSNEKTTQTEGLSKFSIDIGGKSYGFSVNVSANDTNLSVQQKTADAINARDIGVTAKVVVDENTKKSSLVLESKETGAKNAFTVTDTDDNNLMKNLGVVYANQEAQDSIYRLNGGETVTSSSNKVEIAPGVTATLLKDSGGKSVDITYGKDTEGIYKQLSSLVGSFNSLLNTANNSSFSASANLANQLAYLSQGNSNALSNIGIDVAKDGTMTINKDKLMESIRDGSAEKFFARTESGSGFLSKISQTADRIANNPTAYLGRDFGIIKAQSTTAGSSSANSNYYNTGDSSSFALAAKISLLEMKSGVGLFFDASV